MSETFRGIEQGSFKRMANPYNGGSIQNPNWGEPLAPQDRALSPRRVLVDPTEEENLELMQKCVYTNKVKGITTPVKHSRNEKQCKKLSEAGCVWDGYNCVLDLGHKDKMEYYLRNKKKGGKKKTKRVKKNNRINRTKKNNKTKTNSYLKKLYKNYQFKNK